MRRAHVALSIVTLLILVAVFMLARVEIDPSRETVSFGQVAVAGDFEPTSLAPSEREDRGVELATPLDPSVEQWSRRAEVRATEAARQPVQSFSTRRMGGDRRVTVDEDLEIRDHAVSWCAIVGIAEDKRESAADLVVRTQRKWKLLCRSAGSAGAVNPLELDGLREWRRDELGRIVGFEAGDALIAGIKAKQGF